MPTVQTVMGPVDVGALGPTLMHEHVFVLSEEIRQNYEVDWDEEARVDDAVAQLTELASRGITTIVDPTVIGLGRYLPRVRRVAERVKLHIIAATGLYTYDEIPHYFRFRVPSTSQGRSDPMIAMFVRDLRDGIADTGIRAAFLKCAIDKRGLTEGVERVMRAVAAAHRETGAPITVHTDAHSTSGLVVQRVFREEGVDLTKVVIGHSGDSTDLAYLTALADAGSYLGMDRFGIDTLRPFADRVDTVAQLCARGYASRMVLAHDAACHIDWIPEAAKAYNPRWNFLHISDDVLPALRERGVSEADITTMLVENPRRYFS